MVLNLFECLVLFSKLAQFGFALGTQRNKSETSSRISNKNIGTSYQNETAEPSYFSSSIYYGGQENYSPRSSRTTQPHHVVSTIILIRYFCVPCFT